ncbi:MAG: bifunctional oligoribonuclease/PAP phosphatase NrnA [Clostridiales bacterium]|jgi:phosphoesterase RecJ-like protein|nr:bifunctional oligoribonuclease/PAP phosphatase NrnA [Clostridiales bacterium]
MPTESVNNLERSVRDLLDGAQTALIVCHVKPDGDCLGAGFALRHILLQKNKRVDFVTDSEKPPHYAFLKDFEALNDVKCEKYDLAVAVDCADELRLGKYFKVFSRTARSINIDHHPTNTQFGKLNVTDFTASSTCELLYRYLKGWAEIDADTATWLYVGLSADTGNFLHSNTRPETFLTAAELLARGAALPFVVKNLYKNNTVARTRLAGLAITAMRLFEDGRICVMTVTAEMLKSAGCALSDTEGLIDHAANIGSVEVAVCMTEQAPRSYKVSFRSKGPNVSEIAGVFGGGGHLLASGCVVNGYYEDVVDKVLRAIKTVGL